MRQYPQIASAAIAGNVNDSNTFPRPSYVTVPCTNTPGTPSSWFNSENNFSAHGPRVFPVAIIVGTFLSTSAFLIIASVVPVKLKPSAFVTNVPSTSEQMTLTTLKFFFFVNIFALFVVFKVASTSTFSSSSLEPLLLATTSEDDITAFTRTPKPLLPLSFFFFNFFFFVQKTHDDAKPAPPPRRFKTGCRFPSSSLREETETEDQFFFKRERRL